MSAPISAPKGNRSSSFTVLYSTILKIAGLFWWPEGKGWSGFTDMV
jgi:hypothetical protein